MLDCDESRVVLGIIESNNWEQYWKNVEPLMDTMETSRLTKKKIKKLRASKMPVSISEITLMILADWRQRDPERATVQEFRGILISLGLQEVSDSIGEKYIHEDAENLEANIEILNPLLGSGRNSSKRRFVICQTPCVDRFLTVLKTHPCKRPLSFCVIILGTGPLLFLVYILVHS